MEEVIRSSLILVDGGVQPAPTVVITKYGASLGPCTLYTHRSRRCRHAAHSAHARHAKAGPLMARSSRVHGGRCGWRRLNPLALGFAHATPRLTGDVECRVGRRLHLHRRRGLTRCQRHFGRDGALLASSADQPAPRQRGSPLQCNTHAPGAAMFARSGLVGLRPQQAQASLSPGPQQAQAALVNSTLALGALCPLQ